MCHKTGCQEKRIQKPVSTLYMSTTAYYLHQIYYTDEALGLSGATHHKTLVKLVVDGSSSSQVTGIISGYDWSQYNIFVSLCLLPR